MMSCVMMSCGWLRFGMKVGCEVTRGEAMWLLARCHVVSCDVMSWGVVRCGVI